MAKNITRQAARVRRKKRIRNKIIGTQEVPRMSVFRSLLNMSVQIIDDNSGKTLLSVSTVDKNLKGKIKSGGNIQAAKEIGKLIAEKAKEAKIERVVFDRSGYNYHGRVKALAETARENGLKI